VAGSRLPLSVAEKHRILYTHQAPAAELVQLGRRHQEAGFLYDALEFYQRAKAADEIRGMIPLAADVADLTLFVALFKALGEDPGPQLLQSLRVRAQELGKEAVARRAALLAVPKR
jgi:hypothetical protein